MRLTISSEVKKLGIDACAAIVREATISNKSNVLEKRKKELVEKLAAFDILTSPILRGYHELYEQIGLNGFMPPAEHLLTLIKRNGRLPNINTMVDCYNLVSAGTCLSIGAHDLANIEGEVAFRLTDGSEKYNPLGETEPIKIQAGEYACTDDHKVLCRMDVKQCNETKITKETRAFLIYVQGNHYTDLAYLQAGLNQVCTLIKEIGGGSYEIV